MCPRQHCDSQLVMTLMCLQLQRRRCPVSGDSYRRTVPAASLSAPCHAWWHWHLSMTAARWRRRWGSHAEGGHAAARSLPSAGCRDLQGALFCSMTCPPRSFVRHKPARHHECCNCFGRCSLTADMRSLCLAAALVSLVVNSTCEPDQRGMQSEVFNRSCCNFAQDSGRRKLPNHCA